MSETAKTARELFAEATSRSESLIQAVEEIDVDYDTILAWAENHLSFDEEQIEELAVSAARLLVEEETGDQIVVSKEEPAVSRGPDYRGPTEVIQALGELADKADVLILGLVFLLRFRSTIENAVARLQSIGITVNDKKELDASIKFRQARQVIQSSEKLD